MTSGYWLFILMIIPTTVWAILFIKSERIVWWEALSSCGIVLALSGIILASSTCSMNNDQYTESGYVTMARHTPWWHAEWEELVTTTSTDSEGNVTTSSHWEHREEDYPPKWWVESTIGNFSISESHFHEIANEHGWEKALGHRPDYDSGDKYDYFSTVKEKGDYPQYPVNRSQSWINKLKNSGTILLDEKIDEKEAKELGLFEYPENGTFTSSRVIGGVNIRTYLWDQMNAALSTSKDVNVIICYFGDSSIEKAAKQKAYWQNGKRNDIVICYGGKLANKADWAYVFGWSKSEYVKQNIQSILINNYVDDSIVSKIGDAVWDDFRNYDWSSHDDDPVQIPVWAIVLAFVLSSAAQAGLYMHFHENCSFKN